MSNRFIDTIEIRGHVITVVVDGIRYGFFNNPARLTPTMYDYFETKYTKGEFTGIFDPFSEKEMEIENKQNPITSIHQRQPEGGSNEQTIH